MRRFESQPLTARWVAWDGWRAKRGGPTAIAARQQARLQALVEHARRPSRFYAEHYRQCRPARIQLEELDRLPVVTKPALMARFDDWVTDPAVTRGGAIRCESGQPGAGFSRPVRGVHDLRILGSSGCKLACCCLVG